MIERLQVGKPLTSPGANSQRVLYDDSNLSAPVRARRARLMVTAFLDQSFAINTWWKKDLESGTIPRLAKSTTYTGGTDGYVAAVRATQPFAAVAVASLSDNEYVTVVLTVTRNGVVVNTTTKIFEYNVSGSFTPTAGRVEIDVSGVATATEVAVLTAAAIEAEFGSSHITCAVPTDENVTITSANSGSSFAVTMTENVSDAGFTVGSPTAGVDGSIVRYDFEFLTGYHEVVLDTGTAPGEFDVTVEVVDERDAGV